MQVNWKYCISQILPTSSMVYTVHALLSKQTGIHIIYTPIYNFALPARCLTSAFPLSRMICFWYLPLPVLAKSSPTPESPIQKTYLGAFCRPKVCVTQARTSSSVSLRVALLPPDSLRNAPTTSPYLWSSRPTTQASLMAGCATRRSSISAGEIFSPPGCLSDLVDP